jgi:hypothetical protein
LAIPAISGGRSMTMSLGEAQNGRQAVDLVLEHDRTP